MPAVCSVNAPPPISPDVYGFLFLNLSSTIPYHQRAIDPLIIIECKYKRDLYGAVPFDVCMCLVDMAAQQRLMF